MMKYWVAGILYGVILLLGPALRAAETSYEAQIKPILQAHCSKCHGLEDKAANIDFHTLAKESEAKQKRKLWRKAIAQIEVGEMPPADERRFPQITKNSCSIG
jgi:mono/diheme cytochrome c family protein